MEGRQVDGTISDFVGYVEGQASRLPECAGMFLERNLTKPGAQGEPPAIVVARDLDGALENVGTGALGRRAIDEDDHFLVRLIDDLEHRAGLNVHESADGYVVPLGRLAEVHGQRPAQRNEGLILDAFGVPRPRRARLVADQVRSRVPQSGELGERGTEAPRIVVVLIPLELFGRDDAECHGSCNGV